MRQREEFVFHISYCFNDLSNFEPFTVAAFYAQLGGSLVERLRTGL